MFCGFFIALNRLDWCSQYKLRRDAPHLRPDAAKAALDKRAIQEQVIGTFVLVPLVTFLAAPLFAHGGIEVGARTSPAWLVG